MLSKSSMCTEVAGLGSNHIQKHYNNRCPAAAMQPGFGQGGAGYLEFKGFLILGEFVMASNCPR